MKYLVDSDWAIDAITGIPAAQTFLARLTPAGLAISIVSLGELFEGAVVGPDSDDNLATIRRFLSGYTVLDLSDPIMEKFARIRARLRRQEQIIPDLDLLIAATAVAHDLTLVTRNRRHFERIPELLLYQES